VRHHSPRADVGDVSAYPPVSQIQNARWKAIGKACGPDDHGPATSLYLRRGPAKALRRALTATGKQAWPPLTKVLAACSPAQSSVRAAWQYRVAESDPARATSAPTTWCGRKSIR
jgi:hypothetical protein